jgi:hypothetical protein
MANEAGSARDTLALGIAVLGVVAAIVCAVLPQLTALEQPALYPRLAIHILGAGGIVALLLAMKSQSKQGRLAFRIGLAATVISLAGLFFVTPAEVTATTPN